MHVPARFRLAFGWLFLAAQLLGIAYARFGDERLFCWAPFHDVAHTCIRVVIGGRPLSPEEIRTRYRISYPGPRQSIADTRTCLRQHETTYGRADGARVTLGYTRNGHPPQVWRWPESP